MRNAAVGAAAAAAAYCCCGVGIVAVDVVDSVVADDSVGDVAMEQEDDEEAEEGEYGELQW